MAAPNTLFISDLHLSEGSPLVSLFLQFLEDNAKANHLYILGDLFDFFVGEDTHPEFYRLIQEALRKMASKGVALYFMNGNRDFLISSSFLKKAHCVKLNDPHFINLYGIPTLLTHGDSLCTDDILYQRYRKIVQHPLSKAIFLALPQCIRLKMANRLRQKSQQYQKTQTQKVLDVAPLAVEQIMRRYQAKQLIHGHVHHPHIYTYTTNGKLNKRIVLGDWKATHNSFIKSGPTKIELMSFNPQGECLTNNTYSLKEIIY